MFPALQPFFLWCHYTRVGEWIRNHGVAFPTIETFHLFALALLLGSIVMLNLRLFGVTMRERPVRELARDLAPFTISALAVILFTGILLFVSEATRCYQSKPFHLKMLLLFCAITFHFTLYRKRAGSEYEKRGWNALAGILSLLLWFGVGLAGRGIGFLS